MKKILILVAFFIFILTVNAYAEKLFPIHNWDIGTEVSYIEYKEPDVMNNKGIMHGLVGSYTYYDKIMLKVEGRYSIGEVDYKSDNTGSMNNIDDYIFHIRNLGGYNLKLSDNSVLTPYAGFGYRYLNDDSSGMTTTTGHRGYERESNYFYFPIGLQMVRKVKDTEILEAKIEYDYFLKGIQNSHLSDVNLGYNDLKNDQNNGYGLQGSISYNKKGKKIDWMIETFIRYWDIEDSEEQAVTYSGVIIGYGYEPENTTTEVGLAFKLQF